MIKYSFIAVLGVTLCVGGMGFIHWNTVESIGTHHSTVEALYQRQKTIDMLRFALERYRRLSSNFRKAGPAEMRAAKDGLKTAFREGLTRFEALGPSAAGIVAMRDVNGRAADLLGRSAPFEAMLYSKDAYSKAEIRDLHETTVAELDRLQSELQAKIDAAEDVSGSSRMRSLWLLLGVGGLAVALVLFVILRSVIGYSRPLRKLHRFAEGLRRGEQVPIGHLGGAYGEIQDVLGQLVQNGESHASERHKFVRDVIADLRTPLLMLQSGDDEKRGIALLAGGLDDLDDVTDINRLESRLDSSVVDLAEIVEDAAKSLGAGNAIRPIVVTLPSMPIWVQVDAPRMRRMLVQVVSKVMSAASEGSSLLLSVAEKEGEGGRGDLEVSIREIRSHKSDWAPSGPRIDLLRHWISEDGLSMALAHKVVRAHGGQVTASGVAGSVVEIQIILPRACLMSGGLIAPPIGLSSDVRAAVNGTKTILRNSL